MKRKILLIAVLVLLIVFATAPVMSLSASAEEDAGEAEVEAADVQPTATIFSDSFESGPGTWSFGDSNSASGLDYWYGSTYRKHAGTYSVWCAQTGTQSVPTTIFTDDFEGGWYWTAGDWENTWGYDYWGINTIYRQHTGNGAAWCAEVSDHNLGAEYVDLFMKAYMYRTIPKSYQGRYSSFTLSYWYWTDNDPRGELPDYLQVMYHPAGATWGAEGWVKIGLKYTGSHDWTHASISIPNTADAVAFYYEQMGSFYREGSWVDDVTLTGTPASNSYVHKYDDNMEAYMYRTVDLSGYNDVTLSYYYWGDTESSSDYVLVRYRIGSSWSSVASHTGNTNGWIHRSVSIPNTANAVGFLFHSDSKNVLEGSYIDDVVLSATVATPTVLDFWFTPNPVQTGATCKLSGTLKTTGGSAVYPAQVTVDYSVDGGATWHRAFLLSTNAAGQFSTSFTAPGTPGNYLVRGRYVGSASYNPSSHTETLTIAAAAQPTVEIWTNKASYAKRETLTVYVQLHNPGSAINVNVNVWFGLPSGGMYMYETYSLSLPASYTSPVYTWKSLAIPYSAASGTYFVHAEIRNPSTNAVIDHDVNYFTIS